MSPYRRCESVSSGRVARAGSPASPCTRLVLACLAGALPVPAGAGAQHRPCGTGVQQPATVWPLSFAAAAFLKRDAMAPERVAAACSLPGTACPIS